MIYKYCLQLIQLEKNIERITLKFFTNIPLKTWCIWSKQIKKDKVINQVTYR